MGRKCGHPSPDFELIQPVRTFPAARPLAEARGKWVCEPRGRSVALLGSPQLSSRAALSLPPKLSLGFRLLQDFSPQIAEHFLVGDIEE
jgi:hypothetical protein